MDETHVRAACTSAAIPGLRTSAARPALGFLHSRLLIVGFAVAVSAVAIRSQPVAAESPPAADAQTAPSAATAPQAAVDNGAADTAAAAPAAVAPVGLPPMDSAQILAETDAALANPGLGEDARHVVELFRLINATRADHGLYPLRLDARLVGAAQGHASNMAHARYCRHNGLDGSTAKRRIEANGYAHNNWAGENILCSRWTPEDALNWWMNSGPHRRNLLHGHFTHIGIGYDPAGQYGPSWVLNFAAGEPNTIGVGYLPSSGAVPPG